MHKTATTAIFGLCVLTAGISGAASWPEIPQSEKALTEVPGHPGAPAVYLTHEGTVYITEDARSSFLEVYARIKVLTEEGVEYGSVSLSSTDFLRTKDLHGRTHLPDGRIVELSDDATFEKEYSDYYGVTVNSSAMPEVVPGAIIEYRYRTYFDSIYFHRLWYFQAEIPTLHSRITYDIPNNIAFAPLVYKTLNLSDFKENVKETVRGRQITYEGWGFPPVPDEPARFPFTDLSFRVMLLPTRQASLSGGPPYPLFDNWKNAVDLVWGTRDWGYSRFKAGTRNTNKRAKSMAAGNPEATARAIYNWVRDSIETEWYPSVWLSDRTADDILEAERGDIAEKAALLWVMLTAVKLDPEIVWANNRRSGRVEQNVPNPDQFDWVLVKVDLNGTPVYLDPSRRTNAFGTIRAGLQGVHGLVATSKKQDWVTLPQPSAAENLRDVTVALTIDEEGGVSGTGTAKLTGNHALRRLEWKDTRDETLEAWIEWIGEEYGAYAISDVTVDEDIENTTVDVSWSMALRDEEILGDEVIVRPSAPLSVTSNPFTLPPNRRLTPVQLTFPDTDRTTCTVTWPEGWALEAEHEGIQVSTGAGSLTVTTDLDPESRTVTTTRTMVIDTVEFFGGEAYAGLRDLYVAALENDAKIFTLLLL